MALESNGLIKGFIAIDFQLKNLNGGFISLETIRQQNGFVVAFICNHCPYVQAIIPELLLDVAELSKMQVGFVAINSNDYTQYPEDSPEMMVEFAKQHNFSFPYLLDDTQEVARAYGAVCTPDFFGFASDNSLKYRGRLSASRKEVVLKSKRELVEAMKGITQNNEHNNIQNPSIGCSIKWRNV